MKDNHKLSLSTLLNYKDSIEFLLQKYKNELIINNNNNSIHNKLNLLNNKYQKIIKEIEKVILDNE